MKNVSLFCFFIQGWYELVLLPGDCQSKLWFKEGEVAVISTPKPGTGITIRSTSKLCQYFTFTFFVNYASYYAFFSY
jgi:hypothetical protein